MADEPQKPEMAFSWVDQSGPENMPKVKLNHWFFHKMDEVYFQLGASDKEPTLVARIAKNDVVLTLKGVCKEFEIGPETADGQMLDMIGKGLRFVKAIRIGDTLPSEIVTREASWTLSARHREIAYQRVSLQLVNWLAGGDNMITDPDELLQLADDPAIKKSINAAFAEAAIKLNYGIDEKAKVVGHVEELANELAYIEALRDRYRRVRSMDVKIQELRRLYGREKSILEIADQVARLAERALKEFDQMFLEIDAQTGEILSVLKNLNSQIPYIRDKRDDIHVRLMAWDELLDRWDQAETKIDRNNPNLLRDTYKFLAPRFMLVKEWVLMSKLHETSIKAVSQMGDPMKVKKFGAEMKW